MCLLKLIYLISFLILESVSGQTNGLLRVYENCARDEHTFCMGISGSSYSIATSNQTVSGCLMHRNCSHVLHVIREPEANRIVWKYHVRSEPNHMGGEFDLAITNRVLRLSSFRNKGTKGMIPEIPPGLPFMRGWIDGSGRLANEQFYKQDDRHKPSVIRKNRIFTPRNPDQDRIDLDTNEYFNIYTFTSRFDRLVFYDPRTGYEVYHLKPNDPLHITILAYRVLLDSQGNRSKTYFTSMIPNVSVAKLWPKPYVPKRRIVSLNSKKGSSAASGHSHTKQKQHRFAEDQVQSFRALPVWQKFAFAIVWSFTVVFLVLGIIAVCECGIHHKQNKIRTHSFRHNDTPMNPIVVEHRGLSGSQSLLTVRL